MIFFRYIILCCFCLQAFIIYGQQQDKVDFLTARISIEPDTINKKIEGNITYAFKVLESLDSVFLDAKTMQFSNVLLNGKKVKFTKNDRTLTVFKKLKKNKNYKLSITYTAKPKQALYFFGWTDSDNDNNQIWTQGQGKYTSHWLPSFDDMNEKVEFDISITFNKNYEVIANGKLKKVKVSNNLKTWYFAMDKPMSSYLLAFAIGKYHKKVVQSNSGVPLELYYYPKDSINVEPTYRYSSQIFNFLEKEIGVSYPWQVYKQIPVRDFLYAGMENTTTTIFSDTYVVDSVAYNDKNYININAHELAHQWFGDLVTEKNSNHHWLHEGFATYYAYVTEKELFGEDYFNWKLFDTAQQLDKNSRSGNGEALLNPRASSLTFYEKGAWALHALVYKVGKETFRKGVKNYLEKHKYKNVTVSDFLNSIEEVSGTNLSSYKKIWLEGSVFPIEEAKRILKESSLSITSFYKLQRELSVSKENNSVIIDRYWNKTTSTELKKHIIKFYSKSLSKVIKEDILNSNDFAIRQALVLATDKISLENKDFFISFLTDKSYITIENVLYKLWIYNPEMRVNYLDKTKGIIGFSNKNVRQLWLALAIMTKGYEEENKQKYLNELQSYTSSINYFETRQLAFSYLYDLFYLDKENLKDLVHATNHPVWQFKKFARNMVDKLLQEDNYLDSLKELEGQLKKEEFSYIKSVITSYEKSNESRTKFFK